MLNIFQVDPSSIEAALDINIDLPAVAFVGVDDGRIVGSGGLAWGEGRCWLWFKVVEGRPEYARPVLTMARRLLAKARQLGEPAVYTIRDLQFETSPRLLKLTGFVLHAIENDHHIYRCDLGNANG